MDIEEHSHCFMHYFGVKTLSETPFSSPLMQPRYGARYKRAWGTCDDELVAVTNKNGLYRLQARYLVERQSLELWKSRDPLHLWVQLPQSFFPLNV